MKENMTENLNDEKTDWSDQLQAKLNEINQKIEDHIKLWSEKEKCL